MITSIYEEFPERERETASQGEKAE